MTVIRSMTVTVTARRGRGRRVRAAAAAITGAAVLLLTGCQSAPSGGQPGVALGGDHVVILVSGTAAEPLPVLPPSAQAVLEQGADSDNATNGARGRGSVADVVSADGDAHETLPLTPRRADGSVEHGFQHDTLITQNVQAVTQAVSATATTTPGLDLLEGIAHAVRGLDHGVLIVDSNGLSTTGGLDLRKLGWNADPKTAAQQLAHAGLLQSLTGFRLIFVNLGNSAGDQPPLPKPTRDKLNAYWTAICVQAGAASCEIDQTTTTPSPPRSTAPQPVVTVPGLSSITGPNDVTTTSITDGVLGFAGDRWDISPDGHLVVGQVADRITHKLAQKPDLVVTVAGYTADPPGYTTTDLARLGQARSDSVAHALRAAGVTATIRSIGGGKAPGMTAIVHGSFDDTLGAQMRRVEITY